MLYFLYYVGLHYNKLFFLFHDSRSITANTMSKLQTTQGRYDGAMEMKSKIDLQIILLINYMFVYVECSTVKHAASLFSVRKNVTKKERK